VSKIFDKIVSGSVVGLKVTCRATFAAYISFKPKGNTWKNLCVNKRNFSIRPEYWV
jgi:hypothetical protein